MAATYDPDLSSALDWVRFTIGDRDVTAPTLQDEEILAMLAAHQNRWLAAAACVDAILAKTQGAVEKQVGDLRLSFGFGGSAESAYQELGDRLRRIGAAALSADAGRAHWIGVLGDVD